MYTLYTETHSIQHRFIETYSAVVRCKRFCSKSFATFVNFDAHVRVLCFGHMSHNGCPFSILIVVLHSCFTTPYPNASHKHTFCKCNGFGNSPKAIIDVAPQLVKHLWQYFSFHSLPYFIIIHLLPLNDIYLRSA